MASKPLKIYCYVFDLIGPQNASIGFGQSLQKRGHDVQFMVNSQYKGHFAKFGFIEHNLTAPPSPPDTDPVKETCDLILNYKLFDDVPPLEVLRRTVLTGFYDAFFKNWVAFHPQIKEILDRDKPDLIIVDSDVAPPALVFADVPYVYLFCSNPLGVLNLDTLPPFTSGKSFVIVLLSSPYLMNDCLQVSESTRNICGRTSERRKRSFTMLSQQSSKQ